MWQATCPAHHHHDPDEGDVGHDPDEDDDGYDGNEYDNSNEDRSLICWYI